MMNTSDTSNRLKLTGVDNKIKENKCLYSAGICFMIYSIIEISDCVFILLIVLNLVPNIYLDMGINIPQIQQLLKDQPISFLPLFISFTLMRIFATIGIFRNLIWGFYIGVISLGLTMILTMLFIPFGFLELFLCTIILILLVIGFFDKIPIIE